MALATQPYIHPRKSNRHTSPVAAAGDRHGFEMEPALAKKLRNEIARLGQLKRRRNPRPEDQKTVQKLHQKIEAKIATLQCPCPSRYSVEDAARDKQTLARLWRRRRSRAKLTAREDTALAHINARYTAYAWGPEAHGRTRLTALREKRRVFRMAGGPGLSSYERAELRGLATLYPPELSKINEDYHARKSASAPLLGRTVRKRKSTSSAQWGRGSGSDGVADESFPSFHTAPVVRWAPAMTASNDCSIQAQSSSEIVSGGKSLIVWFPCPATCVSSL